MEKQVREIQTQSVPGAEQLRQELQREKYKRRYRGTLRSTIYALITAAAVAVLVATLWLPVLQIYGSSMSPTLREGDIVVSVKKNRFQRGDVVAFYYGNKLLVKRYIAGPGSSVDITEAGDVIVNGEQMEEPYLEKKHLGICDIELPYQVPEDHHFLMGDMRETSVDSRSSTVGCISNEEIVGTIVFRVWPLSDFGRVG